MIVIFGISTLKFAEMQKIVQNKKKKTIFGPKMFYLGILGWKLKSIVIFSASSNLPKCNVSCKIKNP